MAQRLDEQELAIARVYARSLLELADRDGSAGEILAELLELREASESSSELGRFIADPLIETDLRRDVLERMFRAKASDVLLDTLQVMNRKGRLQLLPALAEAYRQEWEVRRGRVEVTVATAVPLTESSRDRLRKALSSFTGLEAELTETVDEGLIGGMVVCVGDRKVDTSVARELRRLGDRLLDRASVEIQAGKTYFAEAERSD